MFNISLSVHFIVAVLLMERRLRVIYLHALSTLCIIGRNFLFIKLHVPYWLLRLISVVQNSLRVCLNHLIFLLQSYN